MLLRNTNLCKVTSPPAYDLVDFRAKDQHHIVPLQSKLVCGLLVPANLREIPGAENSSTGNYYWPDMP